LGARDLGLKHWLLYRNERNIGSNPAGQVAAPIDMGKEPWNARR
jgi:hypothetical protein